MQKSVILHFSRALVDRPIISHIVKTYDVEMNIIQAYITPDEGGHMFAIIEGGRDSVGRTLEYLDGLDVRTILPTRNLVWDEEKCVHCGACIGACRVGALSVDPETMRLIYDNSKCIACELCIPACPFGAMESIGDHLRKKGEL
jgi:ferredoxin